jgi:hypothetical protein
MVLVDGASGHSDVHLLKKKSEAGQLIREAITRIERQFPGRQVRTVRSDGGGEFTGRNLKEWLAAKGITQQTSCPHTPQQNGIAERRNGVLLSTVRTFLAWSGLHQSWWGEALILANECHNSVSSSATPDGVTPHEAWTGEKPDIRRFRRFGCQAIVHTPAHQRGSKVAPTGKRMVHIRHDLEHKGWLFYDPKERKTVISRDAAFLEDEPANTLLAPLGRLTTQPRPEPESMPPVPPTGDPDLCEKDDDPCEATEGQVAPPPTGVQGGTQVGDALPGVSESAPQPVETQVTGEPTGEAPTDGGQAPSTPSGQGVPGQQEVQQEGLPRRSTRDRRAPAPYWIVNPEKALHSSVSTDPLTPAQGKIPIPNNYRESLASPHKEGWQEAHEKEIGVHRKNRTWGEVVDLPPGKTVVGSKWVHAVKYKETGEVERLKARLVAQGFSQREGRDYHAEAIFAPTVRRETIRALAHLGAQEGYEFHLMDVEGAYLYADLTEEVYLQQPEGFVDPSNPTGVLRLRKAIYGLKQSARAWHGRLSAHLIKLGFVANEVDPSLFQRIRGEKKFFVQVYVDDLGLVTNCKEELREFQEDMGAEFKMKDLGKTTYYLGIHFQHQPNQRTVHLHQELYIRQLVEKFGLQDSKVASTPMEEGHTLATEQPWAEGEEEDMANTPYAQLVGSLNYLSSCTRPDIAYSLSVLSRYTGTGKYQRRHWEAAKRVVRYLKGTPRYGVTLGGREPLYLHAHGDASWGDDHEERRSTLGYLTTLGSGPISWKAGRSKTVATSSAESEYYAAGEATREVMSLRQLLSSWGLSAAGPTPISCDSQAALAMMQNPEFHGRTKHIEVKHHFIREKVKHGIIHPYYIQSENNPADILTKALGRGKHYHMLPLMGVQDASGASDLEG